MLRPKRKNTRDNLPRGTQRGDIISLTFHSRWYRNNLGDNDAFNIEFDGKYNWNFTRDCSWPMQRASKGKNDSGEK